MKKNNTKVTASKQRKRAAAKARRNRRKTRLASTILRKLRPLMVENGRLHQQIKELERQINEHRRSGPSADPRGAEAGNTGEGQQTDSVGAVGQDQLGNSGEPTGATDSATSQEARSE